MPEATRHTAETFATTYDLALEGARRIIGAVGTAKIDLDVFMVAYRNRAALEGMMLDPRWTRAMSGA